MAKSFTPSPSMDTAVRCLVILLLARLLRFEHKLIVAAFHDFEASAFILPFGFFFLWVFMLGGIVSAPLSHRWAFLIRTLEVVQARFSRLSVTAQRRIRVLVTVVSLAAVFFQVGGVLVDRAGTVYHGTDSSVFAAYSLELINKGDNPYSHSMATAAARLPTGSLPTARVDGTLVDSLSYPAMSILWFVPQFWLGLGSLDVTPLIILMVVFGYLVISCPWPLCWVPALMLPLSPDLIFFSAGGVFDILWVLPLLVSMQAWGAGRLTAAGIGFGLACAVKQTPWLIAPFLLVWALGGGGLLRTARFVGATLAAFVVVNLPFILNDPSAWLDGILTPVIGGASLVAQGEGLVALNMIGATHLPKAYFTALMVGVFATALILYALHLGRVSWLAWIVPALPLWFGWRSLFNYSVFFLPVAFYAVLLQSRHALPFNLNLAPVRGKWLAAIVSLLVVVGLGAGIALNGSSALPLNIAVKTLSDPQKLGRATQLGVHLRNGGTDSIRPVFIANHSRLQTVMAWDRMEGPERLEPDEAADYLLEARAPVFAIPDPSDFQLAVFDLGEVRWASEVVRSTEARQPHPRNPFFNAWVMSRSGVFVPWGWSLDWTPRGSPWLHTLPEGVQITETREGARLGFESAQGWRWANRVSLVQTVDEPFSTIEIEWRGRTSGSNRAGLEVTSDTGIEFQWRLPDTPASFETTRFSLQTELPADDYRALSRARSITVALFVERDDASSEPVLEVRSLMLD